MEYDLLEDPEVAAWADISAKAMALAFDKYLELKVMGTMTDDEAFMAARVVAREYTNRAGEILRKELMMSEVTQSPEQAEQEQVEAALQLADQDLAKLAPPVATGVAGETKKEEKDGTAEVSDSGTSEDEASENAVESVDA